VLERAVDVACLALIAAGGLVALARGLSRGAWRTQRREIAATLALAVIALVARRALVPASFIQPLGGATRLVEEITGARAPSGEFARVGLAVLGVARTFERVALINELAGVASLGLAGWLAARLSGRAWCAPLAVALGALSPSLARVAASEDFHNLGLLFGLLALITIDLYAVKRDRLLLAISLASTLLMLGTRLTLVAWAPFVVAFGIARGGSRRGLVVYTTLVLAWLALLVRASVRLDGAQLGFALLGFSRASFVVHLIARHPLVTALAPVELYGWIALRRRPGGKVLLALLILLFVQTLPFGFPPAGVQLSFRLPVLLLALVGGAVGAEALLRRLPRAQAVAAALALVAAPAITAGWRTAREVSPAFLEYQFVRSAAAALPDHFALIEFPDQPPYEQPELFGGRRVHHVQLAKLKPRDLMDTVIFLAGVRCRSYTVEEVSGFTATGFEDWRDFYGPPLAGRVFGDVRAPSSVRPECERLIASSSVVGPTLRIESPVSENPFVLYGDAPIEVRYMQLGAVPENR
jgi:hypothetical protein